jgi:hypothetical protein
LTLSFLKKILEKNKRAEAVKVFAAEISGHVQNDENGRRI